MGIACMSKQEFSETLEREKAARAEVRSASKVQVKAKQVFGIEAPAVNPMQPVHNKILNLFTWHEKHLGQFKQEIKAWKDVEAIGSALMAGDVVQIDNAAGKRAILQLKPSAAKYCSEGGFNKYIWYKIV